jgi:hypothetical protein
MSTVLRYELVTVNRAGIARTQEYAADRELGPGDVVVAQGRHWLIVRVEPSESTGRVRAFAKPAFYRLLLRRPDGREEAGARRRYRPGAPTLGHAFTTFEHAHPISWEVVDQRLARDDAGEPYLELIAERDYSELEELPDHELEHTLAGRDWELPEAAEATLSRADEAGLAVELVALEAGEEPDWAEAEEYLDALVFDEIEDDLFELCGVDPDNDPRETWLVTVKERLRADLARFREDIEGDHDQIEEWDFRGGRILASVGSFDDEADPDSGHGWMCRLADGSALGAAGFERVRKAELA